jgi:hypothetical protein
MPVARHPASAVCRRCGNHDKRVSSLWQRGQRF